MSEYRKVETQIRVSREMSPGEKRRRLDKIIRSRNKLAKQNGPVGAGHVAAD